MSLVSHGSQPVPGSGSMADGQEHEKKHFVFSSPDLWTRRLFFLLFLILFYCLELLWIKPVDGINDDFGMYSILSGAYLGYPDAHVLFFLYPLSWLLSKLYTLCSFIPWYGLFLHGVQIACLYAVWTRGMQLWMRHNGPQPFWKPALTFLCVLFLIMDISVLSEAQYTTTAGLAAAAAVFCFMTAVTPPHAETSVYRFLKDCIPSFLFAWISYCIRQNIFYLMLPIAGMIWLSKWILSCRRGSRDAARGLIGFALILLAGMGILYALDAAAYSGETWADFKKINYCREKVGDFYTWPEYEECKEALDGLHITEEEYAYMRSGAPHIGYGMSVEDWEQMLAIARECYGARTDHIGRVKDMVIGYLSVFFDNSMQPANALILFLMLLTFLLILLQRNRPALLVYLLYMTGRTVSWCFVLYQGRFPRRIAQPLIEVDYAVIIAIILCFNLFKAEYGKRYAVILPLVLLLSAYSAAAVKIDIDANYHASQTTWDELTAYCRSHPDRLYIWTYNSGTLENYCESPFAVNPDACDNFVYTNWGVILNPNTAVKLAQYDIHDFGRDTAGNDRVCFILKDAPHNEEHPVLLYLRHTCNARMETVDTFTAGDTTYDVYQLRLDQRAIPHD